LLECVSVAVPELLDQLQVIADINFVGDHTWCGVLHTIGHFRSGGIAQCYQAFRSTSLIQKKRLLTQKARPMQFDAPGSAKIVHGSENYDKRTGTLRAYCSLGCSKQLVTAN
jgi:hypothetical protein